MYTYLSKRYLSVVKHFMPQPETNPLPYLKIIPTGSLPLDIALGIGGIPRGFITELYGAESSGKTTICLSIVTEAQRSDGICAWIDADHALDAFYAARCGVDLSQLLISQPHNSEQALDIALSLVNSQAIALVVIDSTTALAPQAEVQGKLGKSYYQQQEHIMSQGLRKLTVALKRSETAVLLTNQLRHRTGIVHSQDQASTAGLTLKLHAAIRLELREPSKVFQNGVFSGTKVQIRVTKNKFVPTFPTIELELLYNQGIRRIGDIFDLASQHGFIYRRGAAYFYEDLPLGQDREGILQKLLKNNHLVMDLEEALRQRLLPPIRLVERKRPG
jgi:recombination protein RecA